MGVYMTVFIIEYFSKSLNRMLIRMQVYLCRVVMTYYYCFTQAVVNHTAFLNLIIIIKIIIIK